ncbi:MAG: hypothetical protein IK079_05930 [Desulfovibrio sp.]|nr:hypothetical protein [Desulfovibrio sp.]
MNNVLKYGLILVGGIALGAIGAMAVSKGKLDLKPMATDLLSRGLNVKDAILGKVEALKEDLEDTLAAVKQKADAKKTENASAE